MSPLKNDRLIRALFRQSVDRTPVWIMRQAGRYLPEYRALREKAGSFMQLCKTPSLACEVTLQPLRRYALDAAIIFSDILTIPDAMGLQLSFVEGEGPRFAAPLRTKKEIEQLILPTHADLDYVYEAIQRVKENLNQEVPLIGFSGSPWTLAAYMIEGRSKNGFPLALKMLNDDPTLLHQLLTKLAQAVGQHLQAQIDAGADVVMLFDTWGGLLNGTQYQTFSLHYMQTVIRQIRALEHNKGVPLILFTKGGSAWLKEMANTGCDALGIDWEISIGDARQAIGDKVALQGNLHPASLLQAPAQIKQAVAKLLAEFGAGSGHIFNLGHGITPDVPPAHVETLVNAVHELSASYHAQL